MGRQRTGEDVDGDEDGDNGAGDEIDDDNDDRDDDFILSLSLDNVQILKNN